MYDPSSAAVQEYREVALEVGSIYHSQLVQFFQASVSGQAPVPIEDYTLTSRQAKAAMARN
jgi:hypothetical protein